MRLEKPSHSDSDPNDPFLTYASVRMLCCKPVRTHSGKGALRWDDANAEQIRVGLAWAYRKYLYDQSLLDLENEARTAKRGFWIDGDPVPPWKYRKLK